jgi:hypothetical protein
MSTLLDLEPWKGRCTTCGAAIAWAITTEGAAIPVNPAPAVDGNTALTVEHDLFGGRHLVATVLNRERVATARARGMALHTVHFTDCPHADLHRRRKH